MALPEKEYATLPLEIMELRNFSNLFGWTEFVVLIEPRCEKTALRGFRPGATQTGLYSHTRWLDT